MDPTTAIQKHRTYQSIGNLPNKMIGPSISVAVGCLLEQIDRLKGFGLLVCARLMRQSSTVVDVLFWATQNTKQFRAMLAASHEEFLYCWLGKSVHLFKLFVAKDWFSVGWYI